MGAQSMIKKALKNAEKAFKKLHTTGSYNPNELLKVKEYRALIDETANAFKPALSDNDIPAGMLQSLQQDTFVFSALKTNAQLLEASKLLLDAEGRVKPFSAFSKDIANINKNYNQNYLEAEYEFAVTSAQMAGKWAGVSNDYNLQYRTAADDRVRDSHAALNGVTLPANDAFWLSYYPPNGWRCRCNAIEVRKGKYEPTDSAKAIKAGELATTQEGADGKNRLAIFRFNPGAQQKVFPPEHPYGKVKGATMITKALGTKAVTELTNDNIKYLESKGIKVSITGDGVDYFNRLFKGFDLAAMDGELTSVAEKNNFKINSKVLAFNSYGWEFHYETPGTFKLSRNFGDWNGKTNVGHSYFTLSDKLQGQGVSKDVFKGLYKQYRAADIKEIQVSANLDVGGYTWGKYGFSCTSKYDLADIFDKAKDMLDENKLSKNEFKDFKTLHDAYINSEESSIKFPMRDVANTSYGKSLLLGTKWAGEIDLTDDLERKQFEDYLFGS